MNLTNQHIQSAYQNLLTLNNGTFVNDGTGSLLQLLQLTASYSQTSSLSTNLVTSATYPITSSYSVTSSFSNNSSNTITSSNAITASYAISSSACISASYTPYADTAATAVAATTATNANSANTATTAVNALNSITSTSSSYAATASNFNLTTALPYRAGQQVIGNNATFQAVLFSAVFPNTKYAVSITPTGSLNVTTSFSAVSKSVAGFTASLLTGISGGTTIDYIAWLNN